MKYFPEFNENESRPYSNLWDPTKAVLRGKFIAISAYIKKNKKKKKKLNITPERIKRRNYTQKE
jgi:hypothetical protein